MGLAKMSKIHYLKTLPVYFDAVRRGDKTFEIRKNDRDFQTGDTLVLKEFDPALVYERPRMPPNAPQSIWDGYPPEHDGYTGAEYRLRVTYVLHDTWEQLGLDKGFVVLGVAAIENPDGEE
jgi:hypothetical protein